MHDAGFAVDAYGPVDEYGCVDAYGPRHKKAEGGRGQGGYEQEGGAKRGRVSGRRGLGGCMLERSDRRWTHVHTRRASRTMGPTLKIPLYCG